MTGQPHTRWLIACRMMEAFVSRYNAVVTNINSGYFQTTFCLPNVVLSSSLLSEWSGMIDRYKTFSYDITNLSDGFKITIT